VNSGAEIQFRETKPEDFPALLGMMRNLAEQAPGLPFDQGEVRAALDRFLAHPEFGQSWLICLSERIAGYVILTLGYSFEYRGVDAYRPAGYTDHGRHSMTEWLR